MLSMLQVDPEVEKRSIMSQRVPRCNGHRDGFQCKHYWFVECSIQVLNADNFARGERLRRCLRVLPTQNIDYKDLATVCNQYEPSALAYEPQQEVYAPLGDEDIAALALLYAKHRDAHPGVADKDAPFDASSALAGYHALTESNPDDLLVVMVRSRAAEGSADLEARKREGAEAKVRNQAEMAEAERLRVEAPPPEPTPASTSTPTPVPWYAFWRKK